MKKQEVLDFMGWDELPKAAKSSQSKCPVLVERTNKIQDYAISHNGKVIADKKYKAMMTRVIEYYPKKEKVYPPKVDPPKVEKEKDEKPKTVKEKGEPTIREQMIEYLVSKKNKKEVLDSKTNDELHKLSKLFGKEF